MNKVNSKLKVRRYPGPSQFKTEQKNIFFGRNDDIERLFDTILDRKIVTLFSKSGLGKSSLLQAGIIPKFKELKLENKTLKFTPINIRFTAYSGSKSISPLNETIRSIEKDYPIKSSYLHKIIPDDRSIWFFLKQQQRQYINRNNFVLIFDQFEELFTYPEQQIKQFKILLKEGIDSQIPEDYRFELEVLESTNRSTLNKKDLEWLYKPFEIKVVFVIRSDQLSYLDSLGDYFPEILSNRYKLGELTKLQAADAIEEPATIASSDFDCSPFEYSPEALKEILRFLRDGNNQRIESFQLQLICQHIEEIAYTKNLNIIRLEDLGDLESVIQQYYDRQVVQIGSIEDQLLVKRLVEEGLILESDERRITLDEGIVKRDYKISEELLRKLIDLHIVRREANSSGGFNVELSHDALIAPVLESKRIRNEAELANRKIKEERERFEKAELARKLKQRRILGLATVVSSLLFLLAFVAGIFAFLAFNNSEQVSNALQESNKKLEARERELLKVYNELEEKNKELTDLKIRELIEKTKTFWKAGTMDAAKDYFQEAVILDPQNKAILKFREKYKYYE